MQTFNEHLLTHLSEECGEVVQRIAKIERFGLEEIQAGQTETNRRRLARELNQLRAVAVILQARGVLPDLDNDADMAAKILNLDKYAKLSIELGRLEPSPPLMPHGPCMQCAAPATKQRIAVSEASQSFCDQHALLAMMQEGPKALSRWTDL